MKAILIDNYDSFTHNLKAQLLMQEIDVTVVRNDKVSLEALADFDLFVFSPGPSLPKNAGDLVQIIQKYQGLKPMLGICLGLQAMGEVFGAELMLLERPLHGLSKIVQHNGNEIFNGIPQQFQAARYHSWVINPQSDCSSLEIIARGENEEIMGVKHKQYPIYGFQFHPESVLTPEGDLLIQNFISIVKKIKDEKLIEQAV